ncbi:MBL fold metallo-hydrolase [Siminovitchia sediminis]|uniref:MBL fold metallo-hydrolase n=1 Tax=Siminovitchia sediminis TaxID=1274353 RepID=A0ABW4KDP9_9BACI
MEFKEISEKCFYFSSPVNIGYVYQGGEGLLIDTGIDRGTSRKIVKLLKEKNYPINYAILTHAHTDHYGGAASLKKDHQVKLYAPRLEAVIMENPILEPIYLWNGAMPIRKLRNKFLEAAPVTLDGVIEEGRQMIGPFNFEAVSLPGHSYGQSGILINGILYAADSYFGKEVLAKHKVPFIVDVDAAIRSLKKLKTLSFEGAIPGHGEYEADIEETVEANINCHLNIREFLLHCIADSKEGIPMDELLKKLFKQYGLETSEVGQWLLYRTSFTAYISDLIENNAISLAVRESKLWLRNNPLNA